MDEKLFGKDGKNLKKLIKQKENTWLPFSSVEKEGLKELAGFWANMNGDFV